MMGHGGWTPNRRWGVDSMEISRTKFGTNRFFASLASCFLFFEIPRLHPPFFFYKASLIAMTLWPQEIAANCRP